MNEGIKKFGELMRTDETFQNKLKNALESYNGEKSEEAIFESVLTPLAKEYGISATFTEYKNYLSNIELSEDEMDQVAGGVYKPGQPCIYLGTDSDNICPEGIPIRELCMPCGV